MHSIHIFRLTLALLFCFMSTAPLWAQKKSNAKSNRPNNPPLRVELEILENDNPYSLLPLGELGVVVITNQNELGSKIPLRPLLFFDQNLDRRWVSPLRIESEYQYAAYRLSYDSLYLALTSLPHTKSEYPLMQISVCLANGAWRKQYIKTDLPPKLEILSLQMFSDRWAFLGKSKDQYFWYDMPLDPIDPKTDGATLSSEKNLGIDPKMDWCHLAVDTLSRTIYTLFRDSRLKDNALLLCSHSVHGDFLNLQKIAAPNEDFRLVDAKIHIASPSDLWVAGTLNITREKQDFSPHDRGSQSMGLFACRIQNGLPSLFWTKPYYNFARLDTLLSREAWYKYVESKEKAKGRTLIPAFTTQIRIGKASQNGIFLLGEVYERVETTTTEMYYDHYGRMVPYTRSYFEGFRYKDAFYVAFDSSGKDVEERIFDLDQNKLYPNLSSYTQWVKDDTLHQTLYAYPMEDALAFRRIDSLLNPSALLSARLQPLYTQDKVQKTWGTSLIPWYNSYFLAFGHQQIWNNRYSGKSRRSIFYLQKIVMDK